MKLDDFICSDCDAKNELLLEREEQPICPTCGSKNMEISLGGNLFSTIVPSYPGCKKHKAGYMHQYKNRPAEKISVQVKGNVK